MENTTNAYTDSVKARNTERSAVVNSLKNALFMKDDKAVKNCVLKLGIFNGGDPVAVGFSIHDIQYFMSHTENEARRVKEAHSNIKFQLQNINKKFCESSGAGVKPADVQKRKTLSLEAQSINARYLVLTDMIEIFMNQLRLRKVPC